MLISRVPVEDVVSFEKLLTAIFKTFFHSIKREYKAVNTTDNKFVR